MSLRQISSRLELSFWQVIICLLSESRTVQRLIKWAYTDIYPTTSAHDRQFDLKKLILWGAVGLGLGSLCGFLIALL